MQRVFVLDQKKQPLMPCHPARARQMLNTGQAAVYRRYPFTIILKYEVAQPQTQPLDLKWDPGSKASGMSIVAPFARGWVVLWAANLYHRGQQVKAKLEGRRAVRRSRRQRKTRYRQPRYNNRARASISYENDKRVVSRSTNNRQAHQTTGRPSGWMSPSLQSRIDNVYHWTRKLRKLAPISGLQVETVRFDTQKLVNPEISGVEYQQGELLGYEIREFCLEKWGRKCAYCGAKNVPLQLEHIVPRSRGGSDRVSSLTLACEACNLAKGNQTAAEFGHPHLMDQARQPLKDAAVVNATRYALGRALQSTGLSVSFWSGGRTKYNRVRQGYPKDHWVDAACVGETGAAISIPVGLKPLTIKATGRGNRQRTLVDKYGFPRRDKNGNLVIKMRQKRVHGFQTGDIVKAVVPAGKYKGTHIGRIAVRLEGGFRVGSVDGINWKYCSLVQRADGYEYH